MPRNEEHHGPFPASQFNNLQTALDWRIIGPALPKLCALLMLLLATSKARNETKMLKKLEKVSTGTRERILRIAISEFSEKGYSGARVSTICRKSRANPRMIYHYFGGKDGLYVAVLEYVLGELRQEELKLDVEHVSPLDGIMQLFDFTYEHFGQHPELIHILSSENLLRAKFLKRSSKTPVVASPLISLIDQLLKQGEKSAEFRAGIDPLQLYVAMVGFAYFHRSNAPTLSVIFKSDLLKGDWQAEHKRYAKEMLERFLRHEPS